MSGNAYDIDTESLRGSYDIVEEGMVQAPSDVYSSAYHLELPDDVPASGYDSFHETISTGDLGVILQTQPKEHSNQVDAGANQTLARRHTTRHILQLLESSVASSPRGVRQQRGWQEEWINRPTTMPGVPNPAVELDQNDAGSADGGCASDVAVDGGKTAALEGQSNPSDSVHPRVSPMELASQLASKLGDTEALWSVSPFDLVNPERAIATIPGRPNASNTTAPDFQADKTSSSGVDGEALLQFLDRMQLLFEERQLSRSNIENGQEEAAEDAGTSLDKDTYDDNPSVGLDAVLPGSDIYQWNEVSMCVKCRPPKPCAPLPAALCACLFVLA